MEERGLRDVERWRDKIEVRLDNRQVFFLFFGSALVACMLFVLGVIVGKRLESRGRAVSPEIEDPLALLDKVATSPRPAQQGGMTFPQALFGTNSKLASSEKTARKRAAHGERTDERAKPSQSEAATPKATSVATKPEGKPIAGGAGDKKVERSAAVKPEGKPAVAAGGEKKTEKKTEKKREAAAAKAKPATLAAAEKKAEKKPEDKPAEAKEAKRVPIPAVAAGGESKSRVRFALQLSSFQDKAEAEEFAQKFLGEHPYMVRSDIPGKGVWYRVRVGDFGSMKDAMAAKEAFEKKHNVIAYVAQK